LTISGGTVTFKGYIVFSNKILNKMPQITWKDLVLSTSKQDSIDKINLALTNYQSGAML
jgi:hypothetical protein